MKRKLLSLLFCLLFAVNGLLVANPSNGTPTRVPFKRLSPRYEKTPFERTPSKPLYAMQMGTNLFFNTDLVGFNVELISDEMVVFSTQIDENGSVELPENLEGEFELRLYVGENVYVALVEF